MPCAAGGANFFPTVGPLMQSFIEARVDRIYAARGSLWYRNFDWSRYLTSALGQDSMTASAKLVEVLDERSQNVVNWRKSP